MSLFLAPLLCAEERPLAGRYLLSGVMGMASELDLYQNGEFEFGLSYGAADFISRGTWKREGKFVILQSEDLKSPAFRLVRSSKSSRPGTNVLVKSTLGAVIPNIDVLFTTAEGPRAARTAQNGNAYVNASEVRSIKFEIPVLNYESATFPTKPGENEFEFVLNPDVIQQSSFKNERVAIQNGALEMRRFDREHAFVYRRQ